MGHIYLYYGTGGGKTANALGLALRSVGHRQKVVIVQFMKWRTDIGEYMIKDALKPYYEIHQFGRPGWIGVDKRDEGRRLGGTRLQLRNAEEPDRELAKKALEFTKKTMLEAKPNLLVLDEICLAAHLGLLTTGEVLDVLAQIPEETDIVMTGRFAPEELIDRADFVNEVVEIKAPEKFVTKKGIQY